MQAYDLLIRGGTIIDPANRLHTPGDIGVIAGKIAAIEPSNCGAQAAEVIDATGLFVAPGLVDLHTHVFATGTRFGVDADTHCLPSGVTTVLDNGSAGAFTWKAFEREIAESRTRVFALVNISRIGMPDDGELLRPQWTDPDAAVAVIEAHRDRVIGVKTRLSPSVVGANLELVLQSALAATEAAGVRLVIHPNGAETPMPNILDRLRDGDIVSHCFNTTPQSVLDEHGQVYQAARDARRRGVLFDVGHGLASFSADAAARAIAQDFAPDTISSDLHRLNVDGPVRTLANVLSKFLALGLSLDEVIDRATAQPGRILDSTSGIGTLSPGAPADVMVFTTEEGPFEFADAHGAGQIGQTRIAPMLTIAGGRAVTASQTTG